MDRITKEKLLKYFNITKKALEKAKRGISEGKENEASEIIEMVENYIADAEHFLKKGELVNSFGAINYAHGWLDSGARLGIFNVDDREIFTIR